MQPFLKPILPMLHSGSTIQCVTMCDNLDCDKSDLDTASTKSEKSSSASGSTPTSPQSHITDYSYYDTGSDDSLTEEIFGWKCFICEAWAKSGLKLESDFLGCTSITVVDTDGKRWMRCDNCALSCHVSCLNFVRIKGKLRKRCTLVVPEVTWEVIEQNGRFTCC